jgi:hypothetical protein
MRRFIAALGAAVMCAAPASAAVILDQSGFTSDDVLVFTFDADNRQHYLLETSFGERPIQVDRGHNSQGAYYTYRGPTLIDANDFDFFGFDHMRRIDGAHFKVFGARTRHTDRGLTTYYSFDDIDAYLAFFFDQPSGVSYHVRVTEIPRVLPEPSTWAMLIGGFFGAGAMVRSRRYRSPRPS